MTFTIYDIWGILITAIILLVLVIVMIPLYKSFKFEKGKPRRIIGEIFRDIGLALLVGDAFQYKVTELSYYVLLIIGVLLIMWGLKMKEDGK